MGVRVGVGVGSGSGLRVRVRVSDTLLAEEAERARELGVALQVDRDG